MRLSASRPLAVLGGLALAAAATACGGDHGSTAHDARAIDVVMTDNAFAPTQLPVQAGETVTFVFRNDGAVRHEAVLGDEAAQERHHEDMASTGTTMAGEDGHGDDGHDDDGHGDDHGEGAVVVEPGATAELTRTFDEAGTVLIGCHEPGHWEAGMKATVTVA